MTHALQKKFVITAMIAVTVLSFIGENVFDIERRAVGRVFFHG